MESVLGSPCFGKLPFGVERLGSGVLQTASLYNVSGIMERALDN